MNEAANSGATTGGGYCSIHGGYFGYSCPGCNQTTYVPYTTGTSNYVYYYTDPRLIHLLEGILEELRGLRKIIDKQSSTE